MKQRHLIIVSIPLALYSEFLFPMHAGHRHQKSQRKETRELKQGVETRVRRGGVNSLFTPGTAVLSQM